MLLSNKARRFACSNRLFVVNMTGVEQGNVRNEEFMEEVARYECAHYRNGKQLDECSIGKTPKSTRGRHASLELKWEECRS